MGKTIRATRRNRDPDQVVVPTEYARAPTYENPPSATALKLLFEMIAHAGPAIDNPDTWHEMPMAMIRPLRGFRHLTAELLDAHLGELVTYQVRYWIYDTTTQTTDMLRGGVIREGSTRVPGNAGLKPIGAPRSIRWQFGRMFCEIAHTSDFWTMIDRTVIRTFKSRYSIALYQHICARRGLRKRSISLTPEELRAMLGVKPKRLTAFKDLHAQAVKPAVAEIAAHSPFTVTTKLHKRHRAVETVDFTWDDDKLQPSPTVTPTMEATQPPPTPPADAFPATGSIAGTHWAVTARELARNHEPDRLADDYREWHQRDDIPFDKSGTRKRWKSFCREYEKRQSHPRRQPARDHGYDQLPVGAISAFHAFPETGVIRNTAFEALATEYAPNTDPDTIGTAYRDRQQQTGAPLKPRSAAITHEQDFIVFCREWPNPA